MFITAILNFLNQAFEYCGVGGGGGGAQDYSTSVKHWQNTGPMGLLIDNNFKKLWHSINSGNRLPENWAVIPVCLLYDIARREANVTS